jgi:hypothetical protein
MSKDSTKIRKRGKDHPSSSRDRKVERSLSESKRTQEREDTIREVRSTFSVFGHEIASYMVSQYLRFGHLKNVCQSLNLSQPSDLEDQCFIILQYVEEGGSKALLQHLISGSKKNSPQSKPSDKADIEDLLDEAENSLLRQVMKDTPQRRKQKLSREDTRVAEGETDHDSYDFDSLIDTNDDIIIDPKTGRPMKDGKFIERRSGKDRRCGSDRRVTSDRRKYVETIFKNRRFGSDRRSGDERRSGEDRRKS